MAAGISVATAVERGARVGSVQRVPACLRDFIFLQHLAALLRSIPKIVVAASVFFCLSFLFSRTFPGFPHAFPAFAHSASSCCNFFLGGWNQKKLAQGVFPLLLCPNPNMPGAVSRDSPRHRGLRPHVPGPQVPRVVLRSGGPHPPLLRPASGGGGKPNGYGVLPRLQLYVSVCGMVHGPPQAEACNSGAGPPIGCGASPGARPPAVPLRPTVRRGCGQRGHDHPAVGHRHAHPGPHLPRPRGAGPGLPPPHALHRAGVVVCRPPLPLPPFINRPPPPNWTL